jgi:transketolase
MRDWAELEEMSRKIRRDIMVMLAEAGSGHSGGSLSAVEILVALYWSRLRHNPADPEWDERDYFVLSKGHACPVLYAVLAACGYFDRKELWTLRKLDSILQGHPHRIDTPGVEFSTGSLGQGLGLASGVAMAMKRLCKPNQVYCLMGDGEQNEGSIWEAGMTAAHYDLDNLCGIVDRNYLMIDGNTEDVMGLDPLDEKWRAFGWNVIKVDGNDLKQMTYAYERAVLEKRRPTMIIAGTVKGRGVSFMENLAEWHGKPPSKGEQVQQALADLGFQAPWEDYKQHDFDWVG